LFYTRFEFARRLGFFYGQYAISGALGGILSYIVFKAFPSNELPPTSVTTRAATASTPAGDKWRSWQVLFFIEGGMTMVVALVGFFWLPRGPGSAWFLRTHEREWAEWRVLNDRAALSHVEAPEAVDGHASGGLAQSRRGEDRTEGWVGQSRDEDVEQTQRLIPGGDSGFEPSNSPGGRLRQLRNQSSNNQLEIGRGFAIDKGLSKRDVVEAITDWKIWYILVINICSSIPGMAFSVFLPLVVKGLGFESATANLLTVPPFLSGAAALWVFTWWSDKKKERIVPILWGLFLNLVGLTAVVMLPTTAYLLRYLALCLLLAGTFIASPLTVAWLSGNMEGMHKFSQRPHEDANANFSKNLGNGQLSLASTDGETLRASFPP
jgi:Major Facilitator Superfamily